jgi:hypothetical protein
MFLTHDEISRLTGCKRKSDQCAYLDREYIPYRVNARGEPIVTVAYINGQKDVVTNNGWQPNIKVA